MQLVNVGINLCMLTREVLLKVVWMELHFLAPETLIQAIFLILGLILLEVVPRVGS